MHEEVDQDVREAQQESRCLDNERECKETEAGEEENAGEEERRGQSQLIPMLTSEAGDDDKERSSRQEREMIEEEEEEEEKDHAKGLDTGMNPARTITRFERDEDNISERSPPSLLQVCF